jgi:hypothetical protein
MPTRCLGGWPFGWINWFKGIFEDIESGIRSKQMTWQPRAFPVLMESEPESFDAFSSREPVSTSLENARGEPHDRVALSRVV